MGVQDADRWLRVAIQRLSRQLTQRIIDFDECSIAIPFVKILSSISQADADEKIGEFWDTHDFTDFDNPAAPDVRFQIVCAVPIEVELFAALEKQARQRGVQVETLVNLWLQQRLAEQGQQAAA